MRRKITCLTFALAAFLTLFLVKSNAQTAGTVTISGPQVLCVGECGQYEVTPDSGVIASISWIHLGPPSGQISNPFTNPTTICGIQPGTSTLQVAGFIVDQISFDTISFDTILTITITSSLDPFIVSTSALCPDSLSACDKVCAFTTATYEASGVPAGSDVTWTVIGAESYTENGTQLTVDWGGPGQGLVTASAGDSSALVPPVQIYCGQEGIVLLGPSNVTGIGYVHILDGPSPVNITIFGPSGSVTTLSGATNHFSFDSLDAGSHFVTISDNNGVVIGQCDFTIVLNDTECWVSAYPVEYAHASDCNACDGFIQVQALGGDQVSYTFQWSNGSTSASISGLCPGTYSVTVSDAIGCSSIETIQIACPSGCSGSSSLCVDILEEPEAVIGSIPPAVAGIIEVCQGQTVFFQNGSLDATGYAWDFGDANTSAQFEPGHTYNTPGTYTVSLIARNECFCADTTFVTVNVLVADVPEILCTGTICEDETVTYSTDANCGTYNWSITGGGIILDGGGPADNFITVEWQTGPEGTVSLDVSGCAGTVCNLPNVVPIPIVSGNVQIQGPDKVCENSIEEYFIPGFQGTEINWSVEGSGFIESGQGSERITVQWFGDANAGNPQLVIVEYDNCYLGCSGKDTLEVSILPQFYVTGPIQVCGNTTGSYQSLDAITNFPMNSNWTVTDASGATLWTSGGAAGTASVPFTFPPGSYTVRATPASASGFCNDKYDVFVKVIALPPPPGGITGETDICPGESYTYTASGSPLNDFIWTINNGGAISIRNGNPVNVTWGATPPWSVSAAQVATTGLGCTSDTVTLQVGPIPDFSVTGGGQVCKEETGMYAAPFFESVDYQWQVSPAGAGTVISGQGTENVEVFWHTAGAATIQVTVCGSTKMFNVTVLPPPQPVVTATGVCAGQVTPVTTTVAYASYVWKNVSGAIVSTLPTPSLGGGYYEVEVIDANGCMGNTTFFIQENSPPPVTISTPAYYALCSGGPAATIYALNTGTGYDYSWTLDGNPVGGNTSTYSTTTPGIYQVEVTDGNGCTALSNQLELVDCEAVGGTCVAGLCLGLGGGPPVPGCTPAGTIDFNPVQTADCNIFDFSNTSTNFVPGSFSWYFDDPASGANNTSNLQDPSHTFTAPGYYTVILIGEVNAVGGGSCQIGIFKDVLVPAAASFGHAVACPNAPTQFFDESTFVAGGSITNWAWDFGDPASGAANVSTLANPAHVFVASGNYDVTLTITMASGCQTSVTETIPVLVAPSVSFLVPDQTCENLALPFDAIVPASVAGVMWDFGDPGSGAANTSEIENTFHGFDLPAVYAVTLTASNVYGCMASHVENVTVGPNILAGTISVVPPSPVCEGDSTVLTAPAGGLSWEWSNGLTVGNQTIFETGIFTVTLTDGEGCTYTPPPAMVNVTAEPNGIIQAVEYNEFGQPVAFFENSYAVCEGDDVTLTIFGGAGYSYVWSEGSAGDEISFTDDKGNLLSVGTHNYTVTVTDNASGCTSVEGPFTVTVNPKPDVEIESIPSGFICENTTATLSVTGPDPGLTYSWNTGETGTSITVVAGGTYFAQAANGFGCKANSNDIVVRNAPDIDLVPSGCHTRCKPDTMCLPDVPLIASYQWYLDGSQITAPNGTLANPVFTQSGEYFVEMTDVFGCMSTSETLTLDLLDGFGDILGGVYFDVNGNGIIDGPDTLVSGIDIILNDGIVNLDTAASNSGGYIFNGIPANNYTLVLDTTNLPPNWSAVIVSTTLGIIGCGGEEQYDWLLSYNCVPSVVMVDLSACAGDSVLFEGIYIPAGEQDSVTYANQFGCDSTIIATVLSIPPTTGSIEMEACAGDSVLFGGVNIPAGQSADFTYPNAQGCDSILTVNVLELPPTTGTLELSACEGDSVLFDGVYIPAGESTSFTYTNAQGCDSILTVNVLPIPPTTGTLELSACEGDSALFDGVNIPAGQSADFTYPNAQGCDSILTVNVLELPPTTGTLELSACEGDSVLFDGVYIPAGESTSFTYTNAQGCDSILTVNVLPIPPTTGTLELSACEGDSALFDGVNIPAGQSADFTYPNAQGCDSILTVNVLELPPTTGTLELSACAGDSVLFDGVNIPAGQSVDFTYPNAQGCDSILTVNVLELPPTTGTLELSACAGDSVLFDGVYIPAGESTSFTYTNAQGCDSILTVNVLASPTDTASVQLGACPGDSVLYTGAYLQVGDVQTFILTNQIGCDSVVTATVAELPHSVQIVDAVACENSFFEYQGQVILPGQQAIFTNVNQDGCLDTTIVAVMPLPVDSSALSLQACPGETVLYNGVPLGPGSQQYFTLTNLYGCDSVVLVNVLASSTVNYDLAAQEICWNDTAGTIEVQNIQGTTAPYAYSLDGQNWQPGTLFGSLPGGNYTVLLQDANGCIFENDVLIPVVPPMIVEAQDETISCGDSLRLEPTVVSSTPVNWQWEAGSTQPYLTVGSPGVYAFQIANDCETIGQAVNVTLDTGEPASPIYLPNAFSPNNDGINDCFRGYINPKVELLEYRLKIFDRWGGQVFETTDVNGCWDGRRKGRLMDPAVFVWYMTYRAQNCDGEIIEVFKEGGVTLVR
jgi:gliding motility-associated-like protein